MNRLEGILNRIEKTAELPSRGPRRRAAPTSAISPPPGFENAVHQPWDSDAGPDGNVMHASQRRPRPDGSDRHITEKGKRRSKRRCLARKEARKALRNVTE